MNSMGRAEILGRTTSITVAPTTVRIPRHIVSTSGNSGICYIVAFVNMCNLQV